MNLRCPISRLLNVRAARGVSAGEGDRDRARAGGDCCGE
jgi:hypothetical protein